MPVEAVNVPVVPLRNVPPALRVPELEKTILEATPVEVMLPETVTGPVEMRIWLSLVVPVVADRATEAAENVPAPTLIVLAALPLRWIVTAPLAANDAELSARLIEDAPLLVVKLMVVHCAA